MSADVIKFMPTVVVDASVEESTVDHVATIIGLEHEIAELQHVVAEQALQFSRQKAAVPLFETVIARSRLSAAVLMAFIAGWASEDPVTAILKPKDEQVVQRAGHAPCAERYALLRGQCAGRVI